MAYTKLTLKNGETPLDEDTIGHMQDGIYEAHRISVNAVLTSNEMDNILANATDENIGVSYMYLGETTASYKKGVVYTVEKDEKSMLYKFKELYSGGGGTGSGSAITPKFRVVDTDKLEVSYDNGVTWEYLTTLPKGNDGNDGVGIVSIEKTSTAGLVDTYTINLSNGEKFNFNVTNGSSGGSGGGGDITSSPTIKREGTVVTMSVTPEQMDDAFGDMTLCYRVRNLLDNNESTNHTNHIIRDISSLTNYSIDIVKDDVYDENGKGNYCVEAYAIAIGRTKSYPSTSDPYYFQRYEQIGEPYLGTLYHINTEEITSPLDIAKVVDINDWNTAFANIPIRLGGEPLPGENMYDSLTHIGFEIDGNNFYIRDEDNGIVICEVVDNTPNWIEDYYSHWFIYASEEEVPYSSLLWLENNTVSSVPYYDVSNMAFEFYSEILNEDSFQDSVIRANFIDQDGNEYSTIRYERGEESDRIYFDLEMIYDSSTSPTPTKMIIIFVDDTAYIPYDDERSWFWRNGAIIPKDETDEYPPASEGLAFALKDDGTYEVSGIGDCTDTDVVIPAEVDGIAVTSIGEWSLAGSSIINIVIPNSVTSIGNGALGDCHSLISITFGDSVTSIGEYAISNCDGMISIKIPDSVTNIDYCAFSGCSSLTSIIFEGTTAQWSAITFGNDWNEFVPATHVQCSDGQVALT